ncbi:deoxynucleotidyltransferase terminal-interacting protein 1 [Lates japonicus]|uniref:Deoxynucleotidyltransferase terminal-interacting protein 1 n=1 Tax=Lates japonicus TaxID=270547 RepID=A0AAD3NAR5_LATJO|nr:deoxynucleotidyltransferase terminal-interacting protein 1 [Lates japonicus]
MVIYSPVCMCLCVYLHGFSDVIITQSNSCFQREVKRVGPEVAIKRKTRPAALPPPSDLTSDLLSEYLAPGDIISIQVDDHLTLLCLSVLRETKSDPIKRRTKGTGDGGTRGPNLHQTRRPGFKYAADAKDKQWLAERYHMRATGGKMAYLLIEEDIQDLSRSDEYKDCPDVRMDEMKPFTVPQWMVEKMKRAMEAQRDADL